MLIFANYPLLWYNKTLYEREGEQMKKIITVLLMMAVLMCGCGEGEKKTNSEQVDIEQFKCQDSIQTVFDVLGEKEILQSPYANKGYYCKYENLKLLGYKGEVIFTIEDDKDIIDSIYCYLNLSDEELKKMTEYFSEKYGKCEETKSSEEKKYQWDIESKELGYNSIDIQRNENGGYTIKFSIIERDVSEENQNKIEETNNLKESDKETISSEKYEFDGGTVDMTLSKDSKDKYYYTISILSETPWKAAYAYYVCLGIANSEKFKEVAEPNVMMGCGDVFISDIMSWKTNENGETEPIDGTQWISDTLSETQVDEELKEFTDELTGFITDFIQK